MNTFFKYLMLEIIWTDSYLFINIKSYVSMIKKKAMNNKGINFWRKQKLALFLFGGKPTWKKTKCNV